ncbi:MAG: Gfo/Idh/MocA family oxidoreductase [Clostridia bacterium]|nr:Gfo/Idh/MocA family oxidoreductase [Clostridia bacterium]
MKKINVGILGMGYIGESHIEAVRRIGYCNLYAVADTNFELAKKKADFYGIEKCCSSIEELLNDPKVDVIHNCTPNFLHTEINKKIIESGKHLFSEKPLSKNYEEAKELLEVHKKHPEVVAAVNFNYRMNPLVQDMRGRIERGAIGDVRIISGNYLQDWLLYDTDYSWRLEPEVSGISCCIADIGSHLMDLVQHVTGHKITEVMADLATMIPVRKKPVSQTQTFTSAVPAEYEEKKVENEDYGAVLFKTDKGARGVYHASELCAGHGCYFGVEINGSKASLRWNQEENDRLWVGHRDEDNRLVVRNPNNISPEGRSCTALAMGHPEGWNDAFKGNIYSFYDYIVKGDFNAKPVFATLEEAANIVRLTEAIVKSSEKRRWIEIK